MALTDYERAYQQLYRARAGNYSSQQSREFEKALDLIRGSNLSRAAKKEMRTEAARSFLSSGMGTKSGIEESYQRALDESGKAGELMRGQSLSTTQKAHFANASNQVQTAEAVKRTAGSEQVKFAAEVAGGDSDKFYEILGGLIEMVYDDPDATPGELNDYILEFEGY